MPLDLIVLALYAAIFLLLEVFIAFALEVQPPEIIAFGGERCAGSDDQRAERRVTISACSAARMVLQRVGKGKCLTKWIWIGSVNRAVAAVVLAYRPV